MTTRRTTRRGRFYTDSQGRRYWSVTTILGALPKPALPYWAAKRAAEYAVDNLGAVSAIAKDNRDAAVELVKKAPWRDRDQAANVGTQVHEAIEAYVLGRPYPEWDETVAPYMAQFKRFLDGFKPRFLASELTVFNHTQSYAGTLDAIVEMGGKFLLLDVKTGSGVYPEAGAQIAMYRFAEQIEPANGIIDRMPKTDGGCVLHLSPDDYQVIPVQCDEYIFQSALYAREIYRWQHDIAPGVVGEPMVKPTRVITVREASTQTGVSMTKIRTLCQTGCVDGAYKDDRGRWLIPIDEPGVERVLHLGAKAAYPEHANL